MGPPPIADDNPFGAPAPVAPSPAPVGVMASAAQPSFSSLPPSDTGAMGGLFDPMASAMSAAPAPPALAPADDPWGQSLGGGASVMSGSTAPPPPGAMVPSTAMPSDDPFGIFGASAPAPQPEPPAPSAASQPVADASDPWGGTFGAPVADSAPAPPPAPEPVPAPVKPPTASDGGIVEVEGGPRAVSDRKEGDLPPGGEWYDARIFTPTLGVMFFKPQELTDSLFLNTDRELVNALDERPVVAFIVEGSSARSAGVELGHVLLKVNGIDVKNPKEASRLIKEGPRPLPLLFYVPDTQVVVAEGEHMVKYDTRDTNAPNSAKDWKPKYVVIGGIIAQPWMMNMYRSKSEYDIAVIETQARRPVSVKVKQFSLQGARIQNDWQGPQMVKYKNKLHPWKYIVVLPVARNPIKISSPNLSQLKPVHEGIRRVLMAQQRDRGQPGPHTAAPVQRADPYGRNGHGGGGGGGGQDQYDHRGGVSSTRRSRQDH